MLQESTTFFVHTRLVNAYDQLSTISPNRNLKTVNYSTDNELPQKIEQKQ